MSYYNVYSLLKHVTVCWIERMVPTVYPLLYMNVILAWIYHPFGLTREIGLNDRLYSAVWLPVLCKIYNDVSDKPATNSMVDTNGRFRDAFVTSIHEI